MQKNNDEWIEIASVVDSLAYTVKNLSYDTIYRFRVRAENVHGLSEPSESSDEVTLEEPTQNGEFLFLFMFSNFHHEKLWILSGFFLECVKMIVLGEI